MANDRLRLFCKTCRARSPTLAKYWVDNTQLAIRCPEDVEAMSEWLSKHLLLCHPEDSGTLGDDSGLLVITEAQDRALPEPESWSMTGLTGPSKRDAS